MVGTVEERYPIQDYPDGTSKRWNGQTWEDYTDNDNIPNATASQTNMASAGLNQRVLEDQYNRARQSGYDPNDRTQATLDALDNVPLLGGMLQMVTPAFRGDAGNQAVNARDNWVDLKEKARTGKASTTAERQKYRRIFFPVAGEGKGGARNKEAVREQEYQNERLGAGPLAPKMSKDYWQKKYLTDEEWSKVSPEQVRGAQMFRGSKGRPGTPSNPYIPRSREEYDKIPSGASLIPPGKKVPITKP